MVYHFGMLIKVIAGFYIGCLGVVTSEATNEIGVTLVCKEEIGQHEMLATSIKKEEVVKASKEEWDKF